MSTAHQMVQALPTQTHYHTNGSKFTLVFVQKFQLKSNFPSKCKVELSTLEWIFRSNQSVNQMKKERKIKLP